MNLPLQTCELGETGLKVARLGAGGHFTNGPLKHEDVKRRVYELNHMIDSGINYFDVQWLPEEYAMAEVMKTRASEITVSWPLHGVNQQKDTLSEAFILDYCEDHHKRFGIEHVDILLWVGLELEPDYAPHLFETAVKAFEKLKQKGFCDFLGFSCHTSVQMAAFAIEQCDRFDLMMVPFSPLHPAAGRRLLKAAQQKGIARVGMKPFGGGGGFLNKVWSGEFRHPQTDRFHHSCIPYQAALRWVLQQEQVDCMVPAAHSVQQVDELICALNTEFTAEDQALLDGLRRIMIDEDVECQLRGDTGIPGAWD